MKNLLKRLYKEEEGATMVEYGLIVAGIAAVALLAVWTLGEAVQGLFEGFVDEHGDFVKPTD